LNAPSVCAGFVRWSGAAVVGFPHENRLASVPSKCPCCNGNGRSIRIVQAEFADVFYRNIRIKELP